MPVENKIDRASTWKTILYIAIVLQGVPAVAALVVAVVAWGWQDDASAALQLLCYASLVGAAAWATAHYCSRPYRNVLVVNSAAVAVAWLVASVLCAAPFCSISRTVAVPNDTTGALSEPINAWYEATSSISSSGLTVAARSSEIPPSLQLWRSACQWIGGVGLAVFALLLLDSSELGSSLYTAETRSWQPTDNVRWIVLRVLAAYTGLTVACGIGFAATGMPAWESLNHCLIIASTGGLTVTDDSFSSYSIPIQLIASVFMLASAISFGTIYLAGTGRWKQFRQRSELRVMVAWTTGLLLVFSLAAWARSSKDGTDSAFNVVSAISTCGVNSGKLADFSIASVWLLIVAMFIGGCGDSTAGGLKLNRALWMAKITLWQLGRNLNITRSDQRPRWNGDRVPTAEADQRTSRTLVLLFVFLATLAIGFLLLRLSYASEIASDRVLFQATSAIGAVGLSMDLSGPDRPQFAKITEIILMIAGRLEIMACLFVLPVVFGHARLSEPADGDA